MEDDVPLIELDNIATQQLFFQRNNGTGSTGRVQSHLTIICHGQEPLWMQLWTRAQSPEPSRQSEILKLCDRPPKWGAGYNIPCVCSFLVNMQTPKNAFYWSPQVAFLLQAFEINSVQGLLVGVVVFTLLAVLYEGFKCLRLNISENDGERSDGVTILSRAHFKQTVLYLIETCFGYVIMLSVMTYNVWLLLAVLVGAGIGNIMCVLLSKEHKTPLRLRAPDLQNMIQSGRASAECGTSYPDASKTKMLEEKVTVV